MEEKVGRRREDIIYWYNHVVRGKSEGRERSEVGRVERRRWSGEIKSGQCYK